MCEAHLCVAPRNPSWERGCNRQVMVRDIVGDVLGCGQLEVVSGILIASKPGDQAVAFT